MDEIGTQNNAGEGEIIFKTGGEQDEVLKIAPDGFYVRGVKVEADENEALKVFNAVRDFFCKPIIDNDNLALIRIVRRLNSDEYDEHRPFRFISDGDTHMIELYGMEVWNNDLGLEEKEILPHIAAESKKILESIHNIDGDKLFSDML